MKRSFDFYFNSDCWFQTTICVKQKEREGWEKKVFFYAYRVSLEGTLETNHVGCWETYQR